MQILIRPCFGAIPSFRVETKAISSPKHSVNNLRDIVFKNTRGLQQTQNCLCFAMQNLDGRQNSGLYET